MSAVSVRFHGTGMTASLAVEVAVVRSVKPRRCSACRRKRVLYALTFTDSAMGNPDAIWRCAVDWGLRPRANGA